MDNAIASLGQMEMMARSQAKAARSTQTRIEASDYQISSEVWPVGNGTEGMVKAYEGQASCGRMHTFRCISS